MPTDTDQLLSIAEVCELPTDSWVNGGLQGTVQFIEKKVAKKTNRAFWVFRLADSTGSAQVEVAMFTAPAFKDGDTISITGQGIKYKEDQYGRKVSFGEKAEAHILTASTGGRNAPPARQQQQAPQNQERGSSQTQQEQPAQSGAFFDKMKNFGLLYLHCLATARKINLSLVNDGHEKLTDSHFQACVSTLFIKCDKEGLCLNPPSAGKPAAREESSPRKVAPKQEPIDEDVPF